MNAPGRGGPVRVDAVRGHIAVDDLVFADLSSCLSVWSHQGAQLTPETARDLGEALTAWADRHATEPSEVAHV